MNFLQAAKSESTVNHRNSPSLLIRAVPLSYFHFIFRGSHEGGSVSVKLATVQCICGVLNANRTPDIFFDIGKIRSVAKGRFNFKGDCSTAMALDFIDRFSILSRRDGEKDPEKIFARMKLRYRNSGFVFRARQAAFNTLCDYTNCPEDFYTNQLNCLLKFHHRRSKWSTKSFAVGCSSFPSQMVETLTAMENGHYLVRMDQSVEKNWKEEGVHTFVLIRQGPKAYVYDPKFGCIKLTEGTEHLFLQHVILKYRELHQIETVRFFKVAEGQIVCRPSEFSQRLPDVQIFEEYAVLKYPNRTVRVQFVKEEEERVNSLPDRPSPSMPQAAVKPSPPSRGDRKLFGNFIKQFFTDANEAPVPAGDAGAAPIRLSPEVSEVE